MSETRAAWAELLEVLAEAGERFAGKEWMVVDDRDVAEAHRTIAHILQSGLVSHAEFDPDHWQLDPSGVHGVHSGGRRQRRLVPGPYRRDAQRHAV